MKRFILIFIVILNLFIIPVFAEEYEDLDYVWLNETITEAQKQEKLNIYSKCGIAFDRSSKTVIWGKNETQVVPMASTTKIMTAIVFLESLGEYPSVMEETLNSNIEISKVAANTGGSVVGFNTGDEITYNDLLYGLLLCSGNDAAVQIAITVAGSAEDFAILMNDKAEEMGLENTHFVTPHGLDAEEHYTTAYELAIITDYALNIEKFREVVSTKTYTININGYPRTISNTNELLGYLDGVNGVKTGFTNGAGRCLVTSVSRDGFDIITVVLGADTKKIRTKDSINIIEYVYRNYELVNLKEKIEEEYNNWKQINEKRICVNKGTKEQIKTYLEDYKIWSYPILKGTSSDINIEIENIKYFEAPLEKNAYVGNIQVFWQDTQISKINIKNEEQIQKKAVIDYFFLLLTSIMQKV